jgi:hypothetical protein
MNLGEIVTTLSLALSLSALSINSAYSQGQFTSSTMPAKSTFTTESESTKHRGIVKPAGKPTLELNLQVHSKIIPPIKVGTAEVRKNSLYLSLFFDSYQMMFEQINDSTFVEHLYTRNLETNEERYEKFTTIKRNNSLVFTNYDLVTGTARDEKIPLINTTYTPEFLPVMTVVNSFLENKLPNQINVVLYGATYTFNLYTKERKSPNKNNEIEVVKYAKMTELVTRTPDDIILLGEKINIFTTEKIVNQNGKDTTIMYPKKIEAEFAVVNSGIWNGSSYKATSTFKKQQ